MPELSKIDARVSVEAKLLEVKKALDVLDRLTGKAEALELELSKLKEQESATLKDDTRSDESKLPDVLAIRARIDLKSASINSLRGVRATSNNVDSVKGSIEKQEEVVSDLGDIVSQLFKAWNDANIVAYHDHVNKATERFVLKEDRGALMFHAAGRHPVYRKLGSFMPPGFNKDWNLGHSVSILNTRNLEAQWEQLQANADGYDNLSVSVHDAWID